MLVPSIANVISYQKIRPLTEAFVHKLLLFASYVMLSGLCNILVDIHSILRDFARNFVEIAHNAEFFAHNLPKSAHIRAHFAHKLQLSATSGIKERTLSFHNASPLKMFQNEKNIYANFSFA